MRSFKQFPVFAVMLGLAALLGQTPAAAAPKSSITGTPGLTFSVNRTSVSAGETATLSWSSTNVSKCMASGGWSGRQASSGTYRTPQLQSRTRYTLTCYGNTKVERSVLVDVTQPAPTTTTTTSPSTTEPTTTTTTTTVTPKLNLTASASAVLSGQSVSLTWTGEGVSNCQASGSWSGTRSTSGSELRSNLTQSQSYTLTCSSASGTVMAMTSVTVSSSGTQLSWQPPSENIDGSQLTDLAAYRIYVGTISRNYYTQIELGDVSASQYFVNLEPGEYYLAMTAIDAEGNESALSNEVRKIIQ